MRINPRNAVVSEIIEKIQKGSIKTLNAMVEQILMDVEHFVVDRIGAFRALKERRDEVLISFAINMDNNFDELLDREVFRDEAFVDFETMSLVQEEDLEVIMALDGMVNACRNDFLPDFISFHTRLNIIFPQKRIDETTNPLDPAQIAKAFQEAIRPMGMDAQNSLVVFRAFNKGVLKELDQVLQEANKRLINDGVIPDLGMESPKKKHQAAVRAKRRRRRAIDEFGTVEEEEYVDDVEHPDVEEPEMFSMMQNLMRGGTAPSGPGGVAPGTPAIPGGQVVTSVAHPQEYMVPTALIPTEAQDDAAAGSVMQPFQPAAGQQVQMVDQAKLMEILTNIQQDLAAKTGSDKAIPTAIEDIDRLDISESLGEVLSDAEEEGVVNAVDRQSSDVINLVTLLYEAIWDDESVPIPIKELIGRTQITIIKVALSDTSFFNRENHPARAILNEFAAAGIGWTEVEKLGEDPLYKKIQELVEKILVEYAGDISLFEDLLKDFRSFKTREAVKTRRLEQTIFKAKERQERLDEIHELVTQKIDERILGRKLHPFVTDLLENPFHKFMTMLVLKEGPATNAWKQSINTIDVLLWSVQPHKQSSDRDMLGSVNPRLLNNLRKAFRIALVEGDEINSLITRLKEVQEESFEDEPEPATEEEDEILPLDEAHLMQPDAAETEEEEEEDYSSFLEQIEAMAVGIWVEFAGEDDQNTRCKLAAKIKAIDKFIFVNREGVKVVEKTTIGLAKELMEGTVRIISDGLLFSRALETVIGNLRESQQEQQTGSAYQPAT